MNEHPVLAKIDRDRPYFDRSIERRLGDRNQECRLQIWLPVQLDNGGWVAAVRVIGLDMPQISAMPGDDPLGAVIAAIAFAREVMERAEGSFLFGERQMAGLPLFLDRGFQPDVLLDLESRASNMADEAAEHLYGFPMPKRSFG